MSAKFASIDAGFDPVHTTSLHRELLLVQLNVPSDEGGGDYFHRALAPGQALSEMPGVHVINLTNEHRRKLDIIEVADVLVINMVCDPDLLPVLMRRKRARRPTVFELNDDIFDLPLANPRRRFWETPMNRQVMELLLKTVDAVQFSSRVLQEKYGHLNARLAVFPNHLLQIPPERNWSNRRPVIVGWGGSIGHLEDIRTVSGQLSRWLNSREDVRLHLMCAPPIAELFDAVPASRKRLFEPGSMLEYQRFVSKLDIGIAPLDPVSFNVARSDGKFLEYAACGVAPVLQRARPYQETVQEGITGLLFDTVDELLYHLDRLLNNHRERVRIGIAARDWVARHRGHHLRASDRLVFYRGLQDNQIPAREVESSWRIFEKWTRLEGALCSGRHLVLLPTAYEMALRDGLYALEQGKREEAGTCFRTAQSLCPGSYLPYLYLSGCASAGSDEAIAWAQEALARYPESQMCRVILAASANAHRNR